VLALLAELTRVWEAAATAEATRVVAMNIAETSTQVATAVRDSTTLRVKDAEA
jgi:hypothetical protein